MIRLRNDSMLTLDEWRDTIKKNAPLVDRSSHSHNLINLALQAINKKYGKNEANRAVRDFKLESKGWSQQ